MCIVLPTGLGQNTKHQDRYLRTAQQYTEVSTLLWVQCLAQCRKIVRCNQAVMHMSKADVQYELCT